MRKNRVGFYILTTLFMAFMFISVTYAWFTFSGNVGLGTSALVKSWFIEFKDGEAIIDNDIMISSNEIYPGMETIYEDITIDNKGDSDANLAIRINSARILNEEKLIPNVNITSEDIQDRLAHNYPFKINIEVADKVVEAGSSSHFAVSISWPLDSGDNETDTYWGNEAYKFTENEQAELAKDELYQVRRPINLDITVVAEQDVGEPTTLDSDYQFGDEILYDVVNNTNCSIISSNCIKTRVIDIANKNMDQYVTLLPSVRSMSSVSDFTNFDTNYSTLVSNWTVSNRKLTYKDILRIISKDVLNTTLQYGDTSDMIVGSILNDARSDALIQEAITNNGKFSYYNSYFPYLDSSACVWTYHNDAPYGLIRVDNQKSTLGSLASERTCKIVPIIVAPKSNFY